MTTTDSRQRKRHPGREIAIILGIKAVLLFAGYWAFFGPDTRPDVDAEAVERLLFDTAPATIERSDGNV